MLIPPSSQQSAEQVKQLLCVLETQVNNNQADAAAQQLAALDMCLKNWCESELPPTADELIAIQTSIKAILVQATSQKSASFNALLKHKKSDKAINAYKST
ncbi:hypothetical protein [Pseudoalteromonas sp.]|uniref:hypothetical protein n=1 Tax=Pseudoalteromonas sp. TaxID=53249 RepID=UPI0035633610